MPDIAEPEQIRTTHLHLQRLVDEVRGAHLDDDRTCAALEELDSTLEQLRAAEAQLAARSEDLVAALAAIDEERRRYRELFEMAPDPYIETDEAGRIGEANRAAADLLGVPADQLRGDLIFDVIGGSDDGRFRELMAAVVDGVVLDEEVVHLRTRAGREVVTGVTVARHPRPSLGRLHVLWLVRDLTGRRRLESQVGRLTGEVDGLTAEVAGLTGDVSDLTGEVDLLTRALEVQELVGEDPVTGMLEGLLAMAHHALPGVEIGISLSGRRRVETVVSAGERPARLDRRQRDADDGPYVEALRTGVAVRGRPARWRSLADVTDVAEVVAVPLERAGSVEGVLTAYSADGTLAEHEVHLLTVLGRQAAVALQNATLYAASTDLAANLQVALETRAVIERAKGLLMAGQDVDADAAFAMLKAASQRENVKLHDVARRIVDRRARTAATHDRPPAS